MTQNVAVVDQLAFNTVRIACINKQRQPSIGTGFFFTFRVTDSKHIPVIVTNRHVIEGSIEGRFRLPEANMDGSPKIGAFINIIRPDFEFNWIPHPDPEVDLCVMPIASLLRITEEQGNAFFYKTLEREFVASHETMCKLSVTDEIVMIGYPIGICDSLNNMPIFRKGIIATSPELDYEGRKEFMIDAACFPGSSGSPVLLLNRGDFTTKDGKTVWGQVLIKLLGILYAGPQLTVQGELQILPVPTTSAPFAISRIPTNLGLVIKAERLLDFEDILTKM